MGQNMCCIVIADVITVPWVETSVTEMTEELSESI